MDIRKLTRVERNEIIKKFLESNDVGRLYKCIVANTHLKMDHIIYLASFYGISEKCCTLKDWNSQYARIIQGEKASVINDKEKNQFYYFSQSQTTAQQNPNVLISAINVGSKIADRLLEYMPDSGARKKDDLEEAVGLRMIELNNVNPIKPISDILNSNSKLNSGPTNNNIME